MATVTPRSLSPAEVGAYHRDGYVAVRDVIDRNRLAALRQVTDEFLERSRQARESGDVFDLDAGHTAEAPVLRRIKNPADHHPIYHWVAFESPIPDIVSDLLGADVKFNHSKLNLKASLVGAPVDWHQDAAFYPHSNDDVLAVGLLLDDATPENGALAVVPGSHRGPVYEHYDADGRFTGSIRPEDVARLDMSSVRLLALPAGSIHIHHYRLVHGSAENRTATERRLLINAYAAADAVQLVPDVTRSPLFGAIVRGAPSPTVRREAGTFRMPPDWSRGYTSIYALQSRTDSR
jgi:ectoine hydroxylase-related dioxygenase (phytanoyl-CoA dioxygenase family)